MLPMIGKPIVAVGNNMIIGAQLPCPAFAKKTTIIKNSGVNSERIFVTLYFMLIALENGKYNTNNARDGYCFCSALFYKNGTGLNLHKVFVVRQGSVQLYTNILKSRTKQHIIGNNDNATAM